MKFLTIIILFISNGAIAESEIPDDFWENCPGSACPLNSPEFKTFSNDKYFIDTPKDLSKQKAIRDMEKRLNVIENNLEINQL